MISLDGKLLGMFEQDVETLANWYIAGKTSVGLGKISLFGLNRKSLYEMLCWWADSYEIDPLEMEGYVASEVKRRLPIYKKRLSSFKRLQERWERFPTRRRKIKDTLHPYKYLEVEDALKVTEERIERIINFVELP